MRTVNSRCFFMLFYHFLQVIANNTFKPARAYFFGVKNHVCATILLGTLFQKMKSVPKKCTELKPLILLGLKHFFFFLGTLLKKKCTEAKASDSKGLKQIGYTFSECGGIGRRAIPPHNGTMAQPNLVPFASLTPHTKSIHSTSQDHILNVTILQTHVIIIVI